MKIPSFVCAGFRKCGTTSLYAVLSQNKDIYIPPVKETDFFCEKDIYSKGFEWYISRYFKECKENQVAGEINPRLSLMDKDVPKRLYDNLGKDLKIIFIMRNPVESLYSLFKMRAMYGRAFPDEDIELNLMENQSEAFDIFIKQNFLYDESQKKYIAHQDRTKIRMIGSGKYSEYIQEYLKYFSKENMMFIIFEEYIKNPIEVYKEIFKFIGVRFDNNINYNIKANEGNRLPIDLKSIEQYKKIAMDFTNYVNSDINSSLKEDIYRRKKYEQDISKVVKPAKKIYKISENAKEFLNNYYKEEKFNIEKIVNKDLSKLWF